MLRIDTRIASPQKTIMLPDQELLSSALEGYLLGVQAALAKGANIKAGDTIGRTALHLAAASGESHVIHWLIVHGADLSARSNIVFRRAILTP